MGGHGAVSMGEHFTTFRRVVVF